MSHILWEGLLRVRFALCVLAALSISASAPALAQAPYIGGDDDYGPDQCQLYDCGQARFLYNPGPQRSIVTEKHRWHTGGDEGWESRTETQWTLRRDGKQYLGCTEGSTRHAGACDLRFEYRILSYRQSDRPITTDPDGIALDQMIYPEQQVGIEPKLSDTQGHILASVTAMEFGRPYPRWCNLTLKLTNQTNRDFDVFAWTSVGTWRDNCPDCERKVGISSRRRDFKQQGDLINTGYTIAQPQVSCDEITKVTIVKAACDGPWGNERYSRECTELFRGDSSSLIPIEMKYIEDY